MTAQVHVRYDEGDGTPVVFVHAALADGSLWDPVVARAPSGVRSIVLDLPDFAFEAPQTTLAGLEAGVREVVEGVAGGPCVLAGHSFGGWVAARVAEATPERVERLALVGALGTLPEDIEQAYQSAAEAVTSGAVSVEQAIASVVETGLGSARTPELEDKVASAIGDYEADRLVRCLRLVAGLADPSYHVRSLSVPSVLVHAADDASVPVALGEQLAELGRDTELRVLPGDSHLLPLTEPDAVARAVYEPAVGDRPTYARF